MLDSNTGISVIKEGGVIYYLTIVSLHFLNLARIGGGVIAWAVFGIYTHRLLKTLITLVV